MEKSQFDSLVWGSLTLAPIIKIETKKNQLCRKRIYMVSRLNKPTHEPRMLPIRGILKA